MKTTLLWRVKQTLCLNWKKYLNLPSILSKMNVQWVAKFFAWALWFGPKKYQRRTEGGARDARFLSAKTSSFSCSFRKKKWPSNRLTLPLRGWHPAPLGSLRTATEWWKWNTPAIMSLSILVRQRRKSEHSTLYTNFFNSSFAKVKYQAGFSMNCLWMIKGRVQA